MNNKTFKFVNSIYVIMMTNIMALIYLALGLFSFTLVPVIFTVIEVMKELIDEEIDGYSGILKHFSSKLFSNLKKYQKEEIITGIYTLFLIIAMFILRRVNIPLATSVNMLFMYIFAMISIYWSYYALNKIEYSEGYSYLNVVALMFRHPKVLIATIVLFIALIFAGIAMKAILVLFSLSLYGFLFIKINYKAIN